MKRKTVRKIRFWAVVVLFAITSFFLGKAISPTKAETITVYKYKDNLTYKADKLPKVEKNHYYNIPLSHSLQDFIYEICADEGVPVTLVLAMIEAESGFNPEIISPTNDYGLLQINKVNHEWLKKSYRTADMLNPYQNVFCGIKIIGTFVKKYNSDYTKALMAYNMGDYGAKKAWQNGITSTKYSTKILDLMNKYEGDLKNDK